MFRGGEVRGVAFTQCSEKNQSVPWYAITKYHMTCHGGREATQGDYSHLQSSRKGFCSKIKKLLILLKLFIEA